MYFFHGGRQEEQAESNEVGVDALKDLWGITEEKATHKPLAAPVSSDIYHVPSVLRVIPRRSRSRH